ncbi:recombinase, partial [Bacteroides stercoris]
MFKICIVFKISIRRDGGSPCRKRKKEESPAATGSFSGFACGEIART